MSRPGTVQTKEEAVSFLEHCAKYFETRPTKGEDSGYWANVYNAENCRQIVRLLNGD